MNNNNAVRLSSTRSESRRFPRSVTKTNIAFHYYIFTFGERDNIKHVFCWICLYFLIEVWNRERENVSLSILNRPKWRIARDISVFCCEFGWTPRACSRWLVTQIFVIYFCDNGKLFKFLPYFNYLIFLLLLFILLQIFHFTESR